MVKYLLALGALLLVTIPAALSQSCKFKADIAFLLDGSGSVRKENFGKMLSFVEKVVMKYNFGQDDILFGTVLYSSRSNVKFDFNKYTTKNGVLKAIKMIRYPYGSTRTDLGLKDVREKLFTAAGGHRPGVPKILIVMTDGNANYPKTTADIAKQISTEGTNVFSIGIGKSIADSQLQAIASDASKVFRANNFDELVNFIGTLAEKTCKAAEATKRDMVTSNWKFTGEDVGVTVKDAEYVFSQVFGRVLILNGRTSFVTVPRAEISQTSFTISVYIKVDTFGREQAIIGNWGQSSNKRQFMLVITQDNKLKLYLNFNVNGRFVTETVGGGDVGGNKKYGWQVIVVTWNKDQRKASIYLNGELVGSKVITIGTVAPSTSVTNEIGSVISLGGLRFTGEISRLSVYNYPLTVDYVVTFNKKIDKQKESDVEGGGPAICKFRADIAFLLDGSGSVRKENFAKMLDFVDKVVMKYTFGPDDVLFGAVLYSSQSRVKFDFNKYSTKNEILKAVKQISYPYGRTRTDLGLKDVREKLFSAAGGNRPGVPKVLIVMTDGNADYPDDTAEEAKAIKDTGANVFSIGIGSKIDDSELQAIASDSRKVFHATNFDDLVNFIGSLSEKTCRAAEATKKNTIVSDLKFDGTNANIKLNQVRTVTSSVFGKVFILINRNSLVTVPRPQISKSSFTFSVYIKVNKFGKSQVVVGDWGQLPNTQQYLLSITDRNAIRLKLHFLENGNDDYDGLEGGDVAGPNRDNWQVIVVTWDRLTKKATIYLNGDVVAQKVLKSGTLFPTTSITNKVGNIPELGDKFFEGKIARLSIYNYVLTNDYVVTFNRIAGITTSAPTTTTTTPIPIITIKPTPRYDFFTSASPGGQTLSIFLSSPTAYTGPLDLTIYGSSGTCSNNVINRIAGNNVVNKFNLRCPDIGSITKVDITNRATNSLTITQLRIYDASTSTNLNVITSSFVLGGNKRLTATATAGSIPDTVEPAEIPTSQKIGGQSEKVDLIFLIDNTGDMGVYQQVIRYIMSRYHISNSGVHVGVYTVGGRMTEVLPLGPQSEAAIIQQVQNIPTSASKNVDIVVGLQSLIQKMKSGRKDAQKELFLVGSFNGNGRDVKVVQQLVYELKKLGVETATFSHGTVDQSSFLMSFAIGGSHVFSFTSLSQISQQIEVFYYTLKKSYTSWYQQYKVITKYTYSCDDPNTGKRYNENDIWVSQCVKFKCVADRQAHKVSFEVLDMKCPDSSGNCHKPGSRFSFSHEGKTFNGCTCSMTNTGGRVSTSYAC